jgi:hypothetical protein
MQVKIFWNPQLASPFILYQPCSLKQKSVVGFVDVPAFDRTAEIKNLAGLRNTPHLTRQKNEIERQRQDSNLRGRSQ